MAAAKPYRGNWKPKSPVSRHDHVGHMVFLDDFAAGMHDAACGECGQTWTLSEYGWKADPYLGRN